jgi:hypothetical protein
MNTHRRAWLLGCVLTLLLTAGSATPSWAAILYAADGAGGGPNPNANLLILDPATGALVSTVGRIGFSVAGLAFNPMTNELYATTAGRGPSSGSLLRIDPTTGAGTRIGSLGLMGAGTLSDITFDPSGALYGWSGSAVAGTTSLFRINLTTGMATRVGPSPIDITGGGLAADATGRLFLAGPASENLYIVSPTTGAVTPIALLTDAPLPGGSLKALDFDDTGTLFGINQTAGGLVGFLVTINPSTGVITTRGQVPSGVDAIAFGSGSVTGAVPEPSALLLCGAGLLGLGSHVGCRRIRVGRKGKAP